MVPTTVSETRWCRHDSCKVTTRKVGLLTPCWIYLIVDGRNPPRATRLELLCDGCPWSAVDAPAQFEFRKSKFGAVDSVLVLGAVPSRGNG